MSKRIVFSEIELNQFSSHFHFSLWCSKKKQSPKEINQTKSTIHPQLFYKVYGIAFQDDEFNEIIKSSRRIEFLYGHWFDEVIVNADLLAAFEQLLQVVHKIENEPLWVPASWVQ